MRDMHFNDRDRWWESFPQKGDPLKSKKEGKADQIGANPIYLLVILYTHIL